MSINHLYKNLSLNNTILVNKESQDFFLKNIKNIDEKGHEMIYILIKIFEIENNASFEQYKLPYEGVGTPPKEMKFDLEKIPEKLKKIIFKFLTIHLKNMEEEQNIVKERANIHI